MTYKACIDSIKAKTGKTPEGCRRMATEKGPVKYGGLLMWLKTDCGPGNRHASATILYIRDPEAARRKMAEDAKGGK
jgi:Domain of unknown function (DUF4287)